MKNILLLCLLAVGLAANAQTKLISHKSHSGSNAEFHLAVENDLFDIADSNFGLGPEQRLVSRLDTVIYVSADKAVLITGKYSKTYDFDLDKADNEKAPLKFVRSERDTVSERPLFFKEHALDSTREAMKARYSKEMDKVVFIGFDNQKPQKEKKKKGFFPLIDNGFPPKSTFILILLGLSVVVGYFSWRTYRFRDLLFHS